jgi:hypothetical protein
LFIAPIAKVGFIAPVGSTASTTVTPTGSGTAAVTSSQPVNPAQFYNAYSFGGRVGHFKLSPDTNSAPELLSFLDVTVGRFSNLTTLVNNGTATYTTRRWRVAVEGLLKIPATPFTLGMSANVGQNLFGMSAHTVQSAKDDLRFFVGAKFDIGKMIARLQF